MTNPITADIWEGIRARHSLVESAGQPTEAARAMAYLSHLDRRVLIAEIERLQRENEVLATEREQARQRVDFFVGLLARFWNFSPLDVKAPDGRTFQFVDPDPHRTLRVIKEAMAAALADSQVAARASVEPNLTPGPIESAPPDYIVQCRCGWEGKVSALQSLPDFKRGCPRCSAEFKPFAPQPFELPPLGDDDPYRQCSVCGRKSWDEPDIQAICLMPQPNRTRCPGVLRPAQRT